MAHARTARMLYTYTQMAPQPDDLNTRRRPAHQHTLTALSPTGLGGPNAKRVGRFSHDVRWLSFGTAYASFNILPELCLAPEWQWRRRQAPHLVALLL